jgi:hypothetical protein
VPEKQPDCILFKTLQVGAMALSVCNAPENNSEFTKKGILVQGLVLV